MGRWMSKQQKPVKTPNIIKDEDDENREKLKRMIGQMICAEPSHRCSIQLVCDFLDMFCGMNVYTLGEYIYQISLIILFTSWGTQRCTGKKI